MLALQGDSFASVSIKNYAALGAYTTLTSERERRSQMNAFRCPGAHFDAQKIQFQASRILFYTQRRRLSFAFFALRDASQTLCKHLSYLVEKIII